MFTQMSNTKACEEYHSTQAPDKERPFIPMPKGQGTPGRTVEFQSFSREPFLCHVSGIALELLFLSLFQSLSREPFLCHAARSERQQHLYEQFQSLSREPFLCHLDPRDAQRDVHIKQSGSRPFFVASMVSALKRNFYNIVSKQSM